MVVMLFPFVVCGPASAAAPVKLEEFIAMGTSSSGGTFNILGVAMSLLFSNKISGTQFSAEVTGGSNENLVRLDAGQLQLAMASAASAYEAIKGLAMFEGRATKKTRAIANLYPAIMQFPVLKSSGIKTIGDAVGKRINIGQAGSASESQSLSILEAYGVAKGSFTAFTLSHANAADELVDERIDGYINSGSAVQGHQMKAMSSNKCFMANFGPTEMIEKLIERYPYYYKFFLPANTYPDQDYEVETVATGTLLVTSSDVSEELIYRVTKTLFENLEELRQSQEIAKEISLETALNVSGVTLHPGAERYYKEIGVLKN